MSKAPVDIIEKARMAVGDAGVAKAKYGGLEIQVNDAAQFPWDTVFDLLCGVGQDVWVKFHDEHLFIHSKPPAV